MAQHREQGVLTAKMRWKARRSRLARARPMLLPAGLCASGCGAGLPTGVPSGDYLQGGLPRSYHRFPMRRRKPRRARITPGPATSPARRAQEYHPLVKKEAAFVAVDRNASGSRPRELFEDAVEEAEAALEADRAALEAAVKARDVAVPPDGTLDAFRAALEGEEALAELQPTSMCDPAGMFLWFRAQGSQSVRHF